MADEQNLQAAERQFFSALRTGSVDSLDRLLADDFMMIDVFSGSEVQRATFLTAVGTGDVRFDAIQPSPTRVRFYGTTAVVTGSTQMSGTLGESAFGVSSRYTHVYTVEDGDWRLVSAQGTPMIGE